MTNIPWEDVDSSNVKQVFYDDKSKSLAVRFINGGLYVYTNVDMEVYSGLMFAESVGKYLNQAIKGVYPYVKCSDEQDLIQTLAQQA